MATTLALPTASVGPSAWRNEIEKAMSANAAAIRDVHDHIETGKCVDPLPHTREAYAELSNITAFEHMRDVRVVVNNLRNKLLHVNENVKSSNKAKQKLESQLARIRSEMSMNGKTIALREKLPKREKDHQDGVAAILSAEKQHLAGLKMSLERNLKQVKEHLQVLNRSRQRLSDVCQERSRVLDLICNSANTTGYPSDVNTASYLRHSLTNGGSNRCMTPGGTCVEEVGPFDAMTNEAHDALQDANEVTSRTQSLVCEAFETSKKVDNAADEARKAVAKALERKMAETAAMAQRLNLSLVDNRVSTNKSKRHYDRTNYAYVKNKGPQDHTLLPVNERLERPIMKVYQRHPGTQLPESQYIRNDFEKLASSLYNSSRKIASLDINRKKLQDNFDDKKRALDLDGQLFRLRRAKTTLV